MKRERTLDGTLWWSVAALALCLAVFELTNIDLWLQDRFYNFETGAWLVDSSNPWARAIFYDGAKQVIYVIAFGLLVLLLSPRRWLERLGILRRNLGVVALALAITPVLAGMGKHVLNVFCPYEIRRYGGDQPYAKAFEPFDEADPPTRRGGCFPAGHASGGFALMSLFGLYQSRRWRVGAILFGLSYGWAMGLYQMFRGAHYLSHTVVTMLLAWIVVLLLRRLLRAAEMPEKAAALSDR